MNTLTEHAKNRLAPITMTDVLTLSTTLQPQSQPEASEVSSIPPVVLTENEQREADYEDWLDSRMAQYGY